MVDAHQWDVQIALNCEDFEEFEECIHWGCYWYDGECHNEPPVCEEIIDQTECEMNICYWFNESCHANPPLCTELNNQGDCERYGCYWYDDVCHTEPPSPPPDIWKYVIVGAGLAIFAISGYFILKQRG